MIGEGRQNQRDSTGHAKQTQTFGADRPSAKRTPGRERTSWALRYLINSISE